MSEARLTGRARARTPRAIPPAVVEAVPACACGGHGRRGERLRRH